MTEFVSAINKTGEDYNTLALWEAAMDDAGDITASDVKVFAHSGITGTVADLDSVTGQSSGATGTVIHATSTQILIDAIVGTFTSGEEVRVTVGNSVTISNAGDSPSIVAEIYNDQGDLADNVVIDGFTTNATNGIVIRGATGERHDGTDNGAATLVSSSGSHMITVTDNNVEIAWLILDGTSNNEWANIILGSIYQQNIFPHNNIFIADSLTYYGYYQEQPRVLHKFYNNIGYNFTHLYAGLHNAVSGDSGTTIRVLNNTVHNADRNMSTDWNAGTEEFSNNIMTGCIADCIYRVTNAASGSNNICSDAECTLGTLTNGTNNATTYADYYADTSTNDYHIKNTSSLQYNAGADLSAYLTDDIDGDSRPQATTYDIGADEFVAVVSGGRTRRMFISK